MALINQNFDDVPDQFEPVPAGIYALKIDEVSDPEPTKDGSGEKIVVTMSVEDEGNTEIHGRKIFDHIGISKNLTRIKRLAMSAGLNPSADGLDTNDLIGRVAKAKVKVRTYTDDGEQKESSSISDYLVGAES